jgi:hypothetical protein
LCISAAEVRHTTYLPSGLLEDCLEKLENNATAQTLIISKELMRGYSCCNLVCGRPQLMKKMKKLGVYPLMVMQQIERACSHRQLVAFG